MTTTPRQWFQRGSLLLGCGLIVVVVIGFGPRDIARELSRAGPGALWLIAVYVVGTLVSGVPLYLLSRRQPLVTVGGALISRLAAAGANAVLPTFGLGGDGCRLLWMQRDQRSRGIATIVVDRLLFLAASGTMMIVGVVALLRQASLPARVVDVSMVVAALTVLAGAVGIRAVSRGRLAGKTHRLFRKLFRSRLGVPSPGPGIGDQLDAHLEMLIRGNWLPVAVSFILFVVARAILATELGLALWVLGAPVHLGEAVVIGVIPVALSFVAGWIPSQVGIQESSVALVCSAFGISPSAAVAAVLLTRARQVATIALAYYLVARAPALRSEGTAALVPESGPAGVASHDGDSLSPPGDGGQRA